MVISIPYPNAKVAYWLERLHKNTFRGTWCTSTRKVALARTWPYTYFLVSLCSEGIWEYEMQPQYDSSKTRFFGAHQPVTGVEIHQGLIGRFDYSGSECK